MIEPARDWLPIGVVMRSALREAVATSVGDWSAHWFARLSFGACDFIETKAPTDPKEDVEPWLRYSSHVAVRCPKESVSVLMEASLDVGLSNEYTPPADAALLEAMGQAIIEDLAGRIDLALGGAGLDPEIQPAAALNPYGRDGGLEVTIANRREPSLMSLAIPLGAALPMCKSDLAPRTPRPAIGSLADALRPVSVTVEATIGHAEVSLSDLAGLGPGDIVILGATADGLVDLSVAKSGHAFAQGRLTNGDREITLMLQGKHE